MGKCLFMRKGETHTSPKVGLPNGYTELEWIQSSGTIPIGEQYIDTEVVPSTNDFSVVMKVQSTGVTSDENWFLTVNHDIPTGAGNYLQFGTWSSKFAVHLSGAFVDGNTTATNNVIDVTLSVSGSTVSLTGDATYSGTTTNVQSGNYRNSPITIMCGNWKCYGCQVYLNGVLVRDFTPCINPSGEIGLYDTVNKKFYGNKGTGYFSGMDLDGNEVTASILLSTVAEGSIVKVNENGLPVEFYVAKHDYEPTLNGTGRILLVRKNSYGDRAWDDDGNSKNTYATSDIDTWLNGTYKNLFDEKVKSAMGETAIRYTQGNGQFSVSTLSRSVFLPSLTEIGATANDDNCNTEGSRLPIYSKLWLGTNYWTRSPYCVTVYAQVYYWHANNKKGDHQYSYQQFGCLPCFTLPATSVFDADTLVFKGVA